MRLKKTPVGLNGSRITSNKSNPFTLKHYKRHGEKELKHGARLQDWGRWFKGRSEKEVA